MKFGFLAIGLFATASVLQAADTDLPLSVQNALNARNLPHDTLSVFVSDVDTGEVIEFVNSRIENLQQRLVEERGYELVDHHLVLYVKRRK